MEPFQISTNVTWKLCTAHEHGYDAGNAIHDQNSSYDLLIYKRGRSKAMTCNCEVREVKKQENKGKSKIKAIIIIYSFVASKLKSQKSKLALVASLLNSIRLRAKWIPSMHLHSLLNPPAFYINTLQLQFLN